MIEVDIQNLEISLSKKLPASYKTILLNYPDELTQKGNLAEPISDLVLPNNLEQIVAVNQMLNKWLNKSNKIAIGEDGCGGIFFIDPSDEKIYELDHEAPKYFDPEQKLFDFEGSLKVVHNSINEYIQCHLSIF